MKRIPKKILDTLLNFRIKSVGQAIEQFQNHPNLFLPDSKEKIEEIMEGGISNEQLLLQILNHDYIRPAFVIKFK